MTRVEVEVADESWTAALPQARALAEAAALSALASRPDGEAVVLLSGDAEVGDLNRRFRGREGPTNVLSFPAAPSAAPHLGDLVLAFGVCSREARAQGKSLADHLSHLTVHGMLHLLGYDHEHEAEAEVMEGLERTLLATLGVGDPYAGESG